MGYQTGSSIRVCLELLGERGNELRLWSAVISLWRPHVKRRLTLLSHRNFLLFLPTDTQTPPLKAVLSYYSSTYALNAEGDTSIREETLEGLGTISPVFSNYLFGAVIKIAMPPPPRSPPSPRTQLHHNPTQSHQLRLMKPLTARCSKPIKLLRARAIGDESRPHTFHFQDRRPSEARSDQQS